MEKAPTIKTGYVAEKLFSVGGLMVESNPGGEESEPSTSMRVYDQESDQTVFIGTEQECEDFISKQISEPKVEK